MKRFVCCLMSWRHSLSILLQRLNRFLQLWNGLLQSKLRTSWWMHEPETSRLKVCAPFLRP